MYIKFETERLQIRPPTQDDCDEVSAFMVSSPDQLKQWLAWSDHEFVAGREVEYIKSCVSQWEKSDSTELSLLINHKADHELLGMIGMQRIDWQLQWTLINYWVRQKYANKGYILEAMNVLTRYLFTDLDFRHVEIRVNADNKEGSKIPKYLGFSYRNDLTELSEKYLAYVRTDEQGLPPVNLDKYQVYVEPHNEVWRYMFMQEAENIASVLKNQIISIRHIGSTAIPSVVAKPIIDILVSVKDLSVIDNFNYGMKKLGYDAKGEYGLPGRRFFSKRIYNKHTHHVNMFQFDNPEIKRHIIFHEYMRAHPDQAKAYSELKKELAERYPDDIQSYVWGKDEFIKSVLSKAEQWWEKKGHR